SGTGYYHVAIRAWSNVNGTGTELIKANNGNATAWSGTSIGQKIAVSSSGVRVQDSDLSLSTTTPLSITTNLLDIVPSTIDATITLTGTYTKVNSYKMALCTDPNRPVSTRIISNPVIVNRNSSQLSSNTHTVTFTNVPPGTYYATAEAYNASAAAGSNLTANDNSRDAAYTSPDNQSRVAVSTNTITVNASQTLSAITNFTIPLKMDENTHSYSFTGNTNDTSGNGANATPSNATLTSDRNGKANNAYDLNGVNGIISVPVPSVGIVNNFTMSIWFKPTAIHEIDPETANPVAPNVTPGTSGQRYLIYPNHGGDDTGKAGVGISAGTNGISIYEHAGGYMPALLVWQSTITTWTHAVLVYNNRVPSLYVNGNFVKTGVAGLKVSVSPFTNGANLAGENLIIGGLAYGNFPGSVDDFKIFNRILSAAEISRLYQGLI
ncbi:LamG domain-containing protein, partial [bacterium]